MISNGNFEAITELNLDAIKVKLMHKESGEGWSLDKANAVEFEYRRFLILMKQYPTEDAAPLFDVDTFWHYHILDTMKYAADCEAIFGYFLHHFPYVGLRGEADEEAHERLGNRMKELYEETFGEDYIRRAASGQAAWSARITSEDGADQASQTAWSARVSTDAPKTAWSARVAAGATTTAWSARVTTDTPKTAWSARIAADAPKTAWSARIAADAPKTAWSARIAADAPKTAWSARISADAPKTAWSARIAADAPKTAWSARVSSDTGATDAPRTAWSARAASGPSAPAVIERSSFYSERPALPSAD